jgi:hypothetical protein
VKAGFRHRQLLGLGRERRRRDLHGLEAAVRGARSPSTAIRFAGRPSLARLAQSAGRSSKSAVPATADFGASSAK